MIQLSDINQKLLNSTIESITSEPHKPDDCLGCKTFKLLNQNKQVEIFKQNLALEFVLDPSFDILGYAFSTGFSIAFQICQILELEEKISAKEPPPCQP